MFRLTDIIGAPPTEPPKASTAASEDTGLGDNWYVACGIMQQGTNRQPTRIYLLNNDGSKVTIKGNWITPACNAWPGHGEGFITITNSAYLTVQSQCRSKGYMYGQPINTRKTLNGEGGTEAEGWHAFLIDRTSIPPHIWFNWQTRTYQLAMQMTPFTKCTG